MIMRVGIVYRNPSKVQLLKLSNTLFTGKGAIINHSITMGYECTTPIYKSSCWLKNMDVVYRLTIENYEDIAEKIKNYPPELSNWL